MTALIVIGSIVAYLSIGAVYARANAIRYYQHQLAKGRRMYSCLYEGERGKRTAESEAKAHMIGALLGWPVRAPYDLAVGPVAHWITAPLTDRRERAAQLRADATAWRAKRHAGTPAEREMANELARMCDQRAEELDL